MILKEYLLKNPKTHLIFDLDQTLGQLILPWQTIMDKIDYEYRKIDPKLADESRMWNWAGYSAMVKKYGPKIKKMTDDLYLDFETKNLQRIIPNEELVDFIKENKAKYHFYIWSNNQRPTIDKFIKDFDLTGYFEKTVCASDTPFYKPNLEGFDLIYDKSVPKKEYLMIGDGENDKKAAADAGIDYYYTYFVKV